MKLIKTGMLTRYLIKFAFRVAIFIGMLCFYILNKPLMFQLLTEPLYHGVSVIHVLWAVFMVIMIMHIFPTERLSMALRKAQPMTFQPVENYSELELLKYVQTQNVRAWMVMLVWLSFNAVFGILYLVHALDEADLFMLTVFFFLSDYICILFFCPFQTHIMKNRCCVNCRIYDWGHFMMFTPMLFIRSFFTWSLFFTAIIVLIRWEIRYAQHPERFWSGSNKTIQCANCKDKTCQIKKKLANKT